MQTFIAEDMNTQIVNIEAYVENFLTRVKYEDNEY